MENIIAKDFHLTKQTHCGDCVLIPPPEIYPLWAENNSSLEGHSNMSQFSTTMNGSIVYNDIAGEILMKKNWYLTRKMESKGI